MDHLIKPFAENFIVANNIAYKNNPNIRNGIAAAEVSNLVGVDPLFVNPLLPDLKLQANSPALDRGNLNLAPQTDFAGARRPQGAGVDIGAFERGVSAPVALSRGPTADAWLEGLTLGSDQMLRVEANKRVSYMKFDLRDVNAVSSAVLMLTQTYDPGRGTVRVHLGSHSQWTESTLSNSNRPVKVRQLGALTSTFQGGTSYQIELTNLPAGEHLTLILEMDAGGNDVAFSPRTSSSRPLLKLAPLAVVP